MTPTPETSESLLLRIREDVYVPRGVFELSKLAQERGLVIIEGANQEGPDTIEEAIKRRATAMRPPGSPLLL